MCNNDTSLYEQIYSFSNIKRAFYNARHGKLNNLSANKFEINMLSECVNLSDELKNKTYSAGRTTHFKIYYPKERDIESSTFKDKVVQHSYCDNVLYPTICNRLIYDNFASQYGKGTTFALDRLKTQLRHYFFSNKSNYENYRRQNGLPLIPVEQGHYADGWILKCDIRKFFAHIEHESVKVKLQKLLSDEDVKWLSGMIIDSVSTNNNTGLPIGYQSSQLYALVLLNGLDHLIKEKLHIKGYGRYVDDFYLIHHSKSYLKECLRIIKEYLSKYGLELNEKTQIFPIKNGIDFLGFHTYITETGKVICKLRKRNKENIKSKLHRLAKDYHNGLISLDYIIEVYISWRSHASYGNTYYLLKDMDEYFYGLIMLPSDCLCA